MIKSKLFVLGIERELLWTDLEYYRHFNKSGRPNSIPLGGLITFAFYSSSDDDRLLSWMLDHPEDKLCTLTEGKIVFYGEGIDESALFEYKFNDAALIYWKETFIATGTSPMTVTATISAAIQEIKDVTYVKTWQESWVPPSDQQSYQPTEQTNSGLTLEFAHFEDEEGNRINEKYLGKVILVIGTSNHNGERLDIDLSDPEHDFKYNGQVLKDDQLKNIEITGDITRITLEIIEEIQPKQEPCKSK